MGGDAGEQAAAVELEAPPGGGCGQRLDRPAKQVSIGPRAVEPARAVAEFGEYLPAQRVAPADEVAEGRRNAFHVVLRRDRDPASSPASTRLAGRRFPMAD